MSASPAPVLLPDAVALRRPCLDGLSPTRWVGMRESALDVIDRFGDEAVSLGWTAPELLAVHPEHGTLRRDDCGALMISGAKALGVDAHGVRFERGSARRDEPGQAFGMPV